MASASLRHGRLLRRGRPGAVRRWRRRLAGVAIVAVAGATIGYGERWLLHDAPAVTVEFAAGRGFARVLDHGLGPEQVADLHRRARTANGGP